MVYGNLFTHDGNCPQIGLLPRFITSISLPSFFIARNPKEEERKNGRKSTRNSTLWYVKCGKNSVF